MANKPQFRAISAAAAILAVSMAAHAQEQTQQLERIEITGSSIKRFANEGSLPVQIITQEEIKATGTTNVADLVQRIPAMQGFTVGDISIGSNSGGIVTASLHGIGESYTLVLVNGRRVAPTGSGSRINLNSIPMAAIERIEVLTDGASALYGSDAIAGVVNFVLKRNQKGGNISVDYSNPVGNGATAKSASITYGLGDLSNSGFSLVASYRHDIQDSMKASDRAFASSAWVPFNFNGKAYVYDRTSASADPANAQVRFKAIGSETKAPDSYTFNPYLKLNGQCAPNNYYNLSNTVPFGANAASGTATCGYDFVSSIDVYPETKRDSFFTSGEMKLGENFKLFSDLIYTRTDVIARIAANPVPVAISTTSPLYTKYVEPFLSADQRAHLSSVSAQYRANDFGTRDSQTLTDGKHIAIGTEGSIGDWDVNASATWSQNSLNEKYIGGYFKKAEFNTLINSGVIDPFAPSGNVSDAVQTQIDNSIYHGSIRKASTTMKALNAGASGTVFNLPAGEVKLGTGVDFRNYHYKQTPSADAVNGVIYNFSANPKYDLERDNYGAFAELVIPVIRDLEVNAALRYDTITKIKDAQNNRDFGKDESATTYKVSARYKVNKQVLLRGSYGTGFKAPDMLDIAAPLVTNGVTASNYNCPYPGQDACKGGKSQYTQLAVGTEGLKPERSKQATFGVRFDPTRNFGMSVDYWQVKLTDAVSAVTPDLAFADPVKYKDLFTTYQLPAETNPFYAFISRPINIGKATYKGLDWQVEGRLNVEGLGKLTTTVNGTYMINSDYTVQGTNDQITSSLGRYGSDQNVVFRNVVRATFDLNSGKLSNLLRVNYRSGYTDTTADVREVATGAAAKVTLNVPEFITFDWQTTYRYNKALDFRLGINNLTNEVPPLTLRNSSGHQVGYDPRYASPLGRTIYVNGSYNF